MKIRLLRAEDIVRVVPLATEYLKETDGYKDTGFNPSILVKNILGVLSRSTVYGTASECIFIAERGTEILGFLWCVVGEANPWSADKVAMDRVLYVLPEARGTTGIKLLRAYTKWAEAEGAVTLTLSSISGIEDERTEKLYERLGFSNHGFVKVKHLR